VAEADSSKQLAQLLADYAQVLADEHGVEDILNRLGEYCRDLLPVHGIGVLVSVDGDELVIATADTPVGRAVEQLEVDLGGPCIDSLRTGRQVLVPDLAAASDRYPRFTQEALALGVRAVHGIPMSARSGIVGVLDVIGLEPRELSSDQVDGAQLLADVTVAYLANSRAREDSSRLARQLQHALDSRVTVEQAKGVLAERHGETPQQAYRRLRDHARARSQKVRIVAEAVLAGELAL
jgi:GAF domain-containing protein